MKEVILVNVWFLGNGAWANALAHIALLNKHRVQMLCRKVKGNISFEQHLFADVGKTEFSEADLVTIALKTGAVRGRLLEVAAYLNRSTIAGLFKGIEMGTSLLPDEIVEECLRGLKYEYGCMSGPGFAPGVIEGQSTVVNISTKSVACENKIRSVFEIPYQFELTYCPDLKGIETVGALKNLVAILIGIIDGLGQRKINVAGREIRTGENTVAAFKMLCQIDLLEIIPLFGGKKKTLYELAGIADIDLSCSEKSRNYRLGLLVGRGGTKYGIDKMLEEETIEGFYTIKAVKEKLDQASQESVFVDNLFGVFYEDKSIEQAITDIRKGIRKKEIRRRLQIMRKMRKRGD